MTATEAPTDGRHLRRDRNREAVVAALLDLYREGEITPSTDEIAERAGISARSLFRYFDDGDDLVRTAIGRQQEHLAPLFALDVDLSAPLAERMETFVEVRVRLVEAMGQVGRVARNLASKQPRIARELGRIRAVLRGQVADVFAPELAARSRADAAATLGALDVLTSWESYHLLREDQGLSRAAATAAIATGVRRLLGEEG
jgi:TetR/AcrR family transcriptional regulator, regulator of autoinduction and epiphytic fitness